MVSWLVNETYTNKWRQVCKVNVCVLEWNILLFWCRNIVVHNNPSHTICNGHMIHCLRLGNIRNTQYLLILNKTKQFRHKHLLAFLCIRKHQKALKCYGTLHIWRLSGTMLLAAAFSSRQCGYEKFPAVALSDK